MDSLKFIRQGMRRYHEVGAVLPSSRGLARAIVDATPTPGPGEVIVELGPGTGVFTRELFARFPHATLVAIEINPDFHADLGSRFPAVTVIQGCASRAPALLAERGIAIERVAAVVSGLPFVSFPEELRRAIFGGITAVLQPGRHYVQFSYFRKFWETLDLPGFVRKARSPRIWRNIPPATVYRFERTAG